MPPQLINWPWFGVEPFSFFYEILKMFNLFFMIKCCDADCLGIKKVSYPVPNQVINSLHIHFYHQSLLHFVNDSQFFCTLLELKCTFGNSFLQLPMLFM